MEVPRTKQLTQRSVVLQFVNLNFSLAMKKRMVGPEVRTQKNNELMIRSSQS